MNVVFIILLMAFPIPAIISKQVCCLYVHTYTFFPILSIGRCWIFKNQLTKWEKGRWEFDTFQLPAPTMLLLFFCGWTWIEEKRNVFSDDQRLIDLDSGIRTRSRSFFISICLRFFFSFALCVCVLNSRKIVSFFCYVFILNLNCINHSSIFRWNRRWESRIQLIQCDESPNESRWCNAAFRLIT